MGNRLPLVIKALNDRETRLIGIKTKGCYKNEIRRAESSRARSSSGGKEGAKIAGNARVRYLYAPAEAENDTRRRATDPIWFIKTCSIKNVMVV